VQYVSVDALIHPTERLRVAPSLAVAAVHRPSTGEVVRGQRVYRLKTEYQVTAPLFVRLVTEYDGFDRLALRDEGRTNGPLLFRNADGSFTRSVRTRQRGVHTDWLVAWQPGPGTVFFAGYGTASEPEGSSFGALFGRRDRMSDAFFLKASYLIRR
jgi:hypothetical protein